MDSSTQQYIDIFVRWFEENKAVSKDVLEKIDKVANRTSKSSDILAKYNQIQAQGIDITKLSSKTNVGFFDVMTAGFVDWKQWNVEGAKNANIGGKFGNVIRQVTHGMKAFRMELLGVMFFGLGMQQFFMGLLQPALEAFGIFELISVILLVLMVPAMEKLLPWIISLADNLLTADDNTKSLYGNLVLLGAALGTLMFSMAAINLGIGSVELFIGNMAKIGALIMPIVTEIINVITGLFAAAAGAPIGLVIVIIAIITALLLSIIFNVTGWVGAFVGIFTNMLGSVQNIIFGGLTAILGIFQMIFGLIVGLITGDWTLLETGAKTFVAGLIQTLTGMFDILIGNGLKFGYDLLVAFATGIIRAYSFIKEAIRGIPGIGPYIVGGLDIAESVVGKISSAVSSVGTGARAWIKSVTGLAEGGIVSRPTLAMVGEAGPEAIIPLNKTGSFGGNYNISPTYNISATVSNDVDIRELANKLNGMLVDDYRRLSIR